VLKLNIDPYDRIKTRVIDHVSPVTDRCQRAASHMTARKEEVTILRQNALKS